MSAMNFPPTRESQLRDWFVNYRDKLDSGPEAYGLTIEQAGEFVVPANAFIDAYAVATDPATRTTGTIEAKNDAKKVAVEQARKTVAICQASPVMTNFKRDQLQITIRDTDPTPVGVPGVAPELSIAQVTGRVLDLRLREPGSTRRGKPAGVSSAWLYSYVGEAQPTDFELMRFEGATTRTDPQVVIAPTVEAGTKVWVSACWVNPTGQPGPACQPVSAWTNGQSWQVNAAA